MYPRSAEAAQLVRQSHTAISVLDVLHSSKPVARLAFTDGTVNSEGGRTVTRNFTGTVVDPTGAMDGRDIEDLLSPYDCEVMPQRGVLLSNGAWELAPQGIFQLTDRGVNDYSISLTGQDRAIIYQGPMDSPLAISGATPVEEAIRKLLGRRNRGLKMQAWVTGFTCGPLLYGPDIDVWNEALELAKSVGGFLYHDREGDLIFDHGMPTQDEPVTSYSYGDGVLLDANRAEDADTVFNVVIVESSKAGLAGIIRATAEDTDPTSATYAGQKRRPKTITNQHLGSLAQAQQMAQVELAKELGKSETSSVSIIPDPFIDSNDISLVHYPQKGIVQRALVLASQSLPLTVEGGMQLQFRKTIIGRDGRMIDDGSGF